MSCLSKMPQMQFEDSKGSLRVYDKRGHVDREVVLIVVLTLVLLIGQPPNPSTPHDNSYQGQHVLAVMGVDSREHIALPQHRFDVVLRCMFYIKNQTSIALFNFLHPWKDYSNYLHSNIDSFISHKQSNKGKMFEISLPAKVKYLWDAFLGNRFILFETWLFSRLNFQILIFSNIKPEVIQPMASLRQNTGPPKKTKLWSILIFPFSVIFMWRMRNVSF